MLANIHYYNSLIRVQKHAAATDAGEKNDKNVNKNKKLSYHTDNVQCVKRPSKVTQGHPLLCQWLKIEVNLLLSANRKSYMPC